MADDFIPLLGLELANTVDKERSTSKKYLLTVSTFDQLWHVKQLPSDH